MQGHNISGSLYCVSICFSKYLSLLSYANIRHWIYNWYISLHSSNMPPFINRYPHCYHPFGRPLTLHCSFLAERHPCPPHLLYTIFPTNPDVTAAKCPEPLMYKPCVMTAMDYIATHQKPNTPFPKNDGEVGHKPGKLHKGYVLADVLEWPMEVYKEVQVNNLSSLLLVLMIWDSRPSINLLRKICLLLLSRSKGR